MRPPRCARARGRRSPTTLQQRRAALRAKTRRATRAARPTETGHARVEPATTIDRRRSPVPERRHSYVDYLRMARRRKCHNHQVVYEEEVREPLYLGVGSTCLIGRMTEATGLWCPKILAHGLFFRSRWCGIELDLPYGTHDGEVEGSGISGPSSRCGLLVTAALQARAGSPFRVRRPTIRPARTRSPVPIVAAPAPVAAAPPPPPAKPVPAACGNDPPSALFADVSIPAPLQDVECWRAADCRRAENEGRQRRFDKMLSWPSNTPSVLEYHESDAPKGTAPPPRTGFRRPLER